ncbi:bifunctional hydroxymethylpyrimidine kinase/phosphomethylpyrimidine kinase [Amaricoccus sp. W119]|uniref:bifunctional hydroxymethylpyrimidine kinase/phosphomethylpyrimidine kinase n=1 Tax=Amaricoccus sp. W119 TaxID=3391833 RepID=UPI0039A72AA1
MIPNLLTIAGSDPSGGAGIQADLKTFAARGGYGLAVLAALTAQNTTGVTGIHPIPAEFVAAQIETILADVRVDAVKIGMIGEASVAEAVGRALMPLNGVPVVLDPVMIAKGGAALLMPEAVAALRSALLPRATMLTPNLPEAAALLGEAEARTRAEMESQAARLRALGPEAVLLKGGHLEGDTSPDVIATAAGITWLEGARVPTRNTHGTGCSLSSALAAELARGATPEEAARRAKDWLAGAIAASGDLDVGHGHGPVHHFHALWPALDNDAGSGVR